MTIFAYQVNGAGGSSLVSALLVDEKQSLASLGCPGSEVVVLQQCGDLLNIDRLGTEPEKLLGVDKVPDVTSQ